MYKKNGFTLIELLIVIAILAVLAAFIFVALNPVARFQDSRNSRRWADVNAYIQAIKMYQVDNDGANFTNLDGLTDDLYYQIGAGDSCSDTCLNSTVVLQDECIDFEDLVDGGYLPEVLVDPNATGASTDETRYFVMKSSLGYITVGACSEELGSNSSIPDISVQR